MFVGPTGTGKSAYVQEKMMNGLSKDRYLPTFVNFSAQTSANMTQVTFIGSAPSVPMIVWACVHYACYIEKLIQADIYVLVRTGSSFLKIYTYICLWY